MTKSTKKAPDTDAKDDADPRNAETRPVRRSDRPEDAPIVVRKVFILVTSDNGNRSSLADVPLHEVPLLRKKVPGTGGSELKVLGEWPPTAERFRGLTAAQLRDEYETLRTRYTYDKPGGREGESVDLMMDFYGPFNQRRLYDVMRRLEKAWREMMRDVADGDQPTPEQIEEVLALAQPEGDMVALEDAVDA